VLDVEAREVMREPEDSGEWRLLISRMKAGVIVEHQWIQIWVQLTGVLSISAVRSQAMIGLA